MCEDRNDALLAVAGKEVAMFGTINPTTKPGAAV